MISTTDEPLVSTEWLAAHLGDANVKVVDASFKMPGVTPLPVDQLPVDQLPAKELPVKQLPPVDLAAADSATPGSPSGALAALVLGGLFAASAGTVTVARRLGRRAGR